MNIGANLLPLVGNVVNREDPDGERRRHLQAIRALVQDYGLGTIELTGDFPAIYPEVMDRRFYEEIAGIQEELGFRCTVHLPFLWLDLGSLNEEIRRASIASTLAVVEAMAPLTVAIYVAHLWGLWSKAVVEEIPPDAERAVYKALIAQAARSIEELKKKIPAEQLCIENLTPTPLDTLLMLARSQGVRLCLDVGHLASRGEDPGEAIRESRDVLAHVHLHDVLRRQRHDGTWENRDHLGLGRGDVDYARVLEALRQGGFTGAIVLEHSSREDLEASLAALRGYRP
ncbi:MAG: cobamide remodeling phosphodiesterase CbiR [Armatimonadota bacterium]|nr:cobamide remodeling phosphodiesterase CbiR [Armatimonadota bacterium]MDR5702609.1 cobamide remodeling phosphodiesterase CbiR [Armatimonadota bacterium]